MNEEKYRVLILDDDVKIGAMLQEYLQNTNACVVTYISSEPDLWESLRRQSYDILFLDYRLPNTNGLEILERMGEAGFTIPTVMMTGEGSENVAAKAIQTGALDYLVKGEYNFSVLLPLIHKAVKLREMQAAMQQYLEQIRYQAMLLDNMRDAVVVWSLDGAITYWNSAAEQLYGAPASARLGKHVDAVYFPCFEPPLHLPDLNKAGNFQIEHRYRQDGGSPIWISAHFTTLYSEGSQSDPIGYMNVARDVTPRREEQEALVKSQHFIKRILDTSPNIIYILNLQTLRMVYINPEVRAILGYPMEEFHNAPWEKFTDRLHADDQPEMARHLQRLAEIKDGEVQEIAYRFHSQKGDWRWLRARETIFSRGEGGVTVEIIGVIQDITANKLAEDALRNSEARYRAIVEDHQTEMICRFLADARLTFVNEAFCKFYGLPRVELIGTSFLEPVLADEQSQVRELLSVLSSTPPAGRTPVTTFAHRVRLPGGEIRWQEWVSRAIFDRHNNFIEFQAVGRDITERKQMEEQIKAAQTRLTQAARLASIGELASGVAHQISNPLTTIIADAQILSHQLDRAHPARESAEAIVEAGWRAQQVINELMKFSQPAQSSQEPVSVNETIKAALLLSSAHIQAADVNLDVNLDADLPVINANPRQLTDLWVNLLLLARSSFTDGAAHSIRVRSKKNGSGTIHIEVTDDGVPIPIDQYETIFEPQLIPTGEGRGTGIELSICRELVRQNRGEIDICGDGYETTFRITFTGEG